MVIDVFPGWAGFRYEEFKRSNNQTKSRKF